MGKIFGNKDLYINPLHLQKNAIIWHKLTRMFVKSFDAIIIPQCEIFHAIQIIERTFAIAIARRTQKYHRVLKKMSEKKRNAIDYSIVKKQEYYQKIILAKPGVTISCNMLFINGKTRQYIAAINIQRWMRRVYFAKRTAKLIFALFQMKRKLMVASWHAIAMVNVIAFIRKFAIIWHKKTIKTRLLRIADEKKIKQHNENIIAKGALVAKKIKNMNLFDVYTSLILHGYEFKNETRERIFTFILRKYIKKKLFIKRETYYASHRLCIIGEYFHEMIKDTIEKITSSISIIKDSATEQILKSNTNLIGLTYRSLLCFEKSLTVIEKCFSHPKKIFDELSSLKNHFMMQICTITNGILRQNRISVEMKKILNINRKYLSAALILYYVYERIIADIDALCRMDASYALFFSYMKKTSINYSYDNFNKVCDTFKREKQKVYYNAIYSNTCIDNLIIDTELFEESECSQIDNTFSTIFNGDNTSLAN
jgi:hypothetical protein